MTASNGSGREGTDSAMGVLVGVGVVIIPVIFVATWFDAFALPKVTALRLIAGVVLVVLAVRFLRVGMPVIRWIPVLDGAVAAFVILNMAAWAMSTDPSQSFFGERFQYQGLLTILLYVGFFYVARIAFRTETDLARLFAVVAATGGLVSLYALMQKAGLDPWWDVLPQGRVFSSIGQPNALAAYLVVTVPIASAMALRGPRKQRVMWWGVVAAAVAAIGFTLSRGGYLGLAAVAVIASGTALAAGRLTARRVAIGLLAVAGVVAVLALVPQTRSESAQIFDRATSSTDLGSFTTRQRLDLWRIGYEIALDHPIFGAGQETFPTLFPEYRDNVLSPFRAQTFFPYRPESPHNVYLATAAGAGLPALAAYLVFVASAMLALGRAAATRRGTWKATALTAIIAAALGHLVTDLFVTAEVTSTWLFWVLLGAGVSVARPVSRPAMAA